MGSARRTCLPKRRILMFAAPSEFLVRVVMIRRRCSGVLAVSMSNFPVREDRWRPKPFRRRRQDQAHAATASLPADCRARSPRTDEAARSPWPPDTNPALPIQLFTRRLRSVPTFAGRSWWLFFRSSSGRANADRLRLGRPPAFGCRSSRLLRLAEDSMKMLAPIRR